MILLAKLLVLLVNPITKPAVTSLKGKAILEIKTVCLSLFVLQSEVCLKFEKIMKVNINIVNYVTSTKLKLFLLA